MHLIKLQPGTPLGLPAGDYLVENVNAGDFLSREWCLCYSPDGVEYKPFGPTRDWNDKRILFVRPGGYGDLLFLTPIFAEIKRRWPRAEIRVACFDHYFDIFGDNPDIAGHVQYPVSIEDWRGFDAHIWMENIIERNPDARELHVIDLYADRLGLTLESTDTRYFITMDERLSAFEAYPRQNTMFDTRKKPRVGIQCQASGAARTYPHMPAVAMGLHKVGWEVFLFGAPGEIDFKAPPGIVNLTMLNGGLSFRQSCAALATCDVCVAPDSALCHVAGALGIPTVAIYGPFPWKLRTAYAPKTFALQGKGECAPCFFHARAGQQFPAGKLCYASGRCEVLATVDPARVIGEVEKRRPVENVVQMATV